MKRCTVDLYYEKWISTEGNSWSDDARSTRNTSSRLRAVFSNPRMYEVNASAAPVFAASKTLTFTAIIQQFADLVVILWAVLPKQTKIFSGSKSWRGGFRFLHMRWDGNIS